ncbi:hypothetical protein O3M35_000594 [Rhynocoris fuscipes]|uniref:Histone-lysine N-methyltransferase 2C n=1 Tax=Rhynocoris fuscipes TaxID=488301 RepID=A0AAW1DNA0_9HEMI
MDETCADAEGKAGGGGGVEDEMEVGSEEEEDDEEDMELGSSPIAEQPSSLLMPSPTTTPYEGLASPLRVTAGALSGGKPVGIKRGPGRPRSRGGATSQPQVRLKKPSGPKFKRWKGLLVSGVYGAAANGGKVPGDLEEESTSPVQPSTPVDQVKGPIFVDEPIFEEQWPGKVCVLCNLTEHSQLGQGKMCRIQCTLEELPKEIPKELLMSPPETPPLDSTSPRQLFQNRRQKGAAKFRNSGGTQEPVDELSLVGHIDIPEPINIVDAGYIYIHEWCAVWCSGVTKLSDGNFQNVPSGVMAAVARKCYYCSKYGAGSACIIPSCNKHFHTPCAAASAAFQHIKTFTMICNQHIDHVPTTPSFSDVTCRSCNTLGNVNNLVMCSVCGNHHHGTCIGNALQPGLRAGWQCSNCRICQLCRESEDTNRMLVCDSCDKAYHPFCVRPAMSSVPKVGWKCKRCRLCSDCGARTPGGGLSSRWHSNYTVCDSCYQQRNKGFSCPVCHKAYRAAALREMVRCSQCQRFVHGTCDKEADFVSYHRKKEAHPEYEYICLSCKNNTTQIYMRRKDSTEEVNIESALSVSQESLCDNDVDVDSEKSDDASARLGGFGLGKGKPFYAAKIPKKRIGLGVGPGRPKGSGKMSSITALCQYQKRPRFAEFGRKRGPKTKMRGIFGEPGLGLQRPQSDSVNKSEEEPGVENKLVLCSSKDKFVLSQDVCVMCGALGIDQEACLISCTQCGQCYHPYCVSVKVTKVMLQRGWRCLDCTVCEGCGQRNDEGRLILCDDCDISYHIYCMDPPLGSVPTGVWKCKWCAQCQTCGANSPGVNSSWQCNFTQCGACASRTTCPACLELYTDGDLIIKCINCDRWLHCLCDTITNEVEAEACCAQGYTCLLCRPNNTALVLPPTPVRVPSPELPTPEGNKANDYYVDGVCLSETGLQQIKLLSLENNNQPMRRKRPGFKRTQDNEIMSTIDSVASGDAEGDGCKDTVFKDGMIWGSKENGPVPSPPEGFSLITTESGVVVLKRKKMRNLQKLGIGGFSAVKMRSSRFKDDEEGGASTGGTSGIATTPGTGFGLGASQQFTEEKPRRKPRWTKKRCKLAEHYPSFLQEAFFGRELLDTTKESTAQELESSSDESDEGKAKVSQDKTITLSNDELKVMAEVKAKQEEAEKRSISSIQDDSKITVKEEEVSDGEGLKDILNLPDNLLNNDIVNTIMNERDEIKTENLMSDQPLTDSNSNQKDELSDILGPHFSIDAMVRETGLPNMDSKDVEEIFKGVLTDESQESQTSGAFPPTRGPTPGTPGSHPHMSPQQAPSGSRTAVSSHPSNLTSPIGFPSASPYHSEYSNSPQFSPEGSPWNGDDSNSCNARTSVKMEADEPLGTNSTISPVLYANLNHPELRAEYPSWNERFKQILKKWRALPNEKRAPYITQARENRTNIRLKRVQQEQDKTQTIKTTRECEQERQWKQMQALRQQQILTQSRNQATRIQRQVSADGTTLVQFTADTSAGQQHLTQQLQVATTAQEVSGPGLVSGLTSPRAAPQTGQFTSPVVAAAAGVQGTIKITPRGISPANAGLIPRGVVGMRPPQATTAQPSPFSPPPRQPMPEEMNRQLRDLLQRQQVVKQDGTNEGSALVSGNLNVPIQTVPQIRQPLPQQRAQTVATAHALHGVDARVRQLLQQQRPTFAGTHIRIATARQQLEQFNVVQRQQFQTDASAAPANVVRTAAPTVVSHQRLQSQVEARISSANREGEEIPESVTAELEKLEQEGGMAEVESVSAILGDLGEDDDELLAEMGPNFNILEYADPELDSVTGGEKTNILDDLEDEEEKNKQTNTLKVNTKPTTSIRTEQKQETKEELNLVQEKVTSISVQREVPVLQSQNLPTTTSNTIMSHLSAQAPESVNQLVAAQTKVVNKSYSTFVTPTTPLPRMQLLAQGGTVPTVRATTQISAVQAQGQSFIQIPAPPPPYPGPPPPYPGQLQTAGEQPLLLEDLLEEEKREQEQQSVTTPGSSSGASLMSDADFEILRADVLGTNNQVASPPNTIQSVPILNIPLQPAPPPPPDNIITEQDRQLQIQYEQWLHSNNAAVTQQLKYYETEVQKLRKIRKSLNSKQRQLRKNGNQLPQKDAMELQRVTGEQTVLQKHLEAARKQSKTHSMVMQEYQNKQEQKGNAAALQAAAAAAVASHSVAEPSPPQSPGALISPNLVAQQATLPSPQTAASPLQHHSPRIGTPHSQGGDDRSDSGGLASPRAPTTPMAPTPPSPHQFHQIRHPSLVPRFVVRSPESGLRPRISLPLQAPSPSSTPNTYNSPRGFATSPQPQISPSLSPQAVISNQTIRAPGGLTQQQLLLQRHQLQQQKQQLLQQQELQQHQEAGGNITRQLQEGHIQRQILLRQGILQQDDTLSPQQIQMLRQQQLVQQNRQQLILTQQGKVGQFRQLIQQNQPTFTQNTTIQSQNTAQFAGTSPMPPSPIINQSPSPISSSINNVQQFNPSSSPLHPQSPMISPFHSSSSPMPQQSPRVQQSYQTASSPMTPQSPMVYTGLQTPTSPMPQFNQPNSPMPPHSPRVQQQQQYGQPPSSPMNSAAQSPMIQQQFVHRPNSPMVSMGSPMPIRRPSSTGGSVANSPATERPQSVENPRTPQELEPSGNNGSGGGGNPYNPHNPIPFPPDFTYIKLGLRGGSPMWNDKPVPRKSLYKAGKVGQPSAGSSSDESKSQKDSTESNNRKIPSLVCVDYNEFDEESRTPPITPPAKPALIKKPETGAVKTRQSEDTDSELTVIDDIVLVESCNEANLEVAELQSALEGNVMSTVVSMPMVIDPGHIQMMDVDAYEDCLVSSTDLVVLDDANVENDCMLEVSKDEDEDILIIEDEIGEGLKDEDMMELEEDLPSPPHGRRLIGKVLPGEPIIKEDETETTTDSPEDDLANQSPDDNITSELESVAPAEENLDVFKNTEETKVNKVETVPKETSPVVVEKPTTPIKEREKLLTPNIQPNVVVNTKTAVTFTPVVTQKSIPIYSERRLRTQQEAVESLVQGAVKLAQHLQKTSTEMPIITSSTVTTTSESNALSHFYSKTVNVSSNKSSVVGQQALLPLSVVTHKSDVTLAGAASDLAENSHKKELMTELKKDVVQQEQQTASTVQIGSTVRNLEANKLVAYQSQDNCSSISSTGLTKLADLLNKNDKPVCHIDKDMSNFKKEPIKIKTDFGGNEREREFQETSKLILKGNETLEPNITPMANYQTDTSDLLTSRTSLLGDNKSDKLEFNILEKRKPSTEGSQNNRMESVTLPAVSSSILEAQLTSMLRSSSEQNSNQKFIYAIVNHNVSKETKREDDSIADDLKVEGLAAHFRSLKNEDFKNADNKLNEDKLNKIQPSTNLIKHGNLFMPTAKVKGDTVVVGGTHYKLVHSSAQGTTALAEHSNSNDNLSQEYSIATSKHNEYHNSISNHQQQHQQQLLIKQDINNKTTLSLNIGGERRLSTLTLDNKSLMANELLQQRIVSSSESSPFVSSGDKETHHVSFTGMKLLQKDDSKKFVSLTNMLLPRRDISEDKTAASSSATSSVSSVLPNTSRINIPKTPEESQNVLLKQLLQNTACATTTAAAPTSSLSTPSVPMSVPSLEAQLARPVPPTPTSLLPSVLNEPSKPQPPKEMLPQPIKTTVQSTISEHLQHIPQIVSQQAPPPRISSAPSLDELLSPPPSLPPPPPPSAPPAPLLPPPASPQVTSALSSSSMMIPHSPSASASPAVNVTAGAAIKREPLSLTQPGPIMTPMLDIKKEILPVNMPVAVEVKKEVMSSDEMLSPSLRTESEHPSEAALQDMKKQKRRQYQQKRRQSLGKESVGGTPKKRPRKSSKVEEDYDAFIDSLMHQLRQTPALSICEPNLTYNFTGSPVFGSGDLSKVNSSTRFGELRGTYGNASLPHENDHYNTLPFGDLPPRAPTAPSTQRGFYNEEFAPLKLQSTKDEFDDRKYDYNRDRDNDTPDTIVSSSSPECIMPEVPTMFPGLQFVDSDTEEEKVKLSRFSPDIPYISPLIVRPKPIRYYSDMDKENEGPNTKKHCENVTVTLTLNSPVDDVMIVLRNLANVLRIPVPVHYSITERNISTNHKLGIFKIKGKDGKEGGQIDIQSILNGAAKFCRHCDVVIINNLVRKKGSEMPLVAKQGEEDLYFCSSTCYMQLALSHPQQVHNDKVATVIDHRGDIPSKKIRLDDSLQMHDTKKENQSEVSSYIGTRGAGKRDSNYKTTDKNQQQQQQQLAKKSPSRCRTWMSTSIPPPMSRHKKPTDKEMTEMLFKCGITVMPAKLPDDTRSCLLCHQIGDGVTDGPARLLNFDVNKWVHLNCALWSEEVYETVNGGLVNVEVALQNGLAVLCSYCNTPGATLKCFKMRCSLVYHLPCAVKDQCVFYKNKTLYCNSHVPKNDKENELTTLSVMRRVYISRDENRQVASIMHHSEQTNLLRVGSLIFLSVGQLLPHQLQAFHTPNYIYPIGYKILRMYWSMRTVNKRCKYICSIHDNEGKPEFRIVVQEKDEPDLELKDTTAKGVWLKVLEPITAIRKAENSIQMFSKYITGEDLFGLTEPAIVRVLESLPGVETLSDYKFKYGRNPLLELPLAINPTGCARTEGKPKGQGLWKRAHTQRTCSISSRPSFSPSIPLPGELSCPYSKQFVHSKSSQYKKMKQEWRNNVYLARSKIQGLGLYAARDLERHTMVIEYIGEIIRSELAETREKQYEAKNRGIYMFRLDEDRVVDATLCGGLARYINHSCSPNCVAETVEVERDVRIIIFTKRRINRGEELAYDYKFDIEDDQHKIPCMCGAPNCRKWMN